jgi:hypothetical protein
VVGLRLTEDRQCFKNMFAMGFSRGEKVDQKTIIRKYPFYDKDFVDQPIAKIR